MNAMTLAIVALWVASGWMLSIVHFVKEGYYTRCSCGELALAWFVTIVLGAVAGPCVFISIMLSSLG